GKEAAELAAACKGGEFRQAGQMQLVLDHAVLDAARLRLPQQRARRFDGGRHRFFAIDVFAGGDRAFKNGGALVRRRRIEEDRVSGITERGVEIGGPIRELVSARDRGKASAARPTSSKRGTRRSSPSASPPSSMMGTRAFARCWVEPMRPVAPWTMMPIILVAIVQTRCCRG